MEIDPFVWAWIIGALWCMTHPRRKRTRGIFWADLTKRR